MDELFGDTNITPNNITITDDIIELDDVMTDLSTNTLEEQSQQMKEETLARTRQSLNMYGVTEDYLIKGIKDIAEYAVIATKDGNIIDDYATKLSALKKLDNMREKAYKVDRKDPVEFIFKPVFAKPPKLS